MAYTYDDFVGAAKNAGLYDSFGQEDLTMAQSKPEYGLSLLKLQKDAGKATTEEQKLLVQEAVNQLRSTYGVTVPAAAPASTGSFSYDREKDYQNLLKDTATPGSFNYDHRTDGTYGAMKESWFADGDRTRDKMIQTPTVPKTQWAGNAAQQSNNYYDARLTDQIPTLYQDAYSEFLNEQGKRLSQFGALAADKEFDYAAYLQQLQLDQQKAQQEFDNAMTLHKQFGTKAPTIPDLDGLTPGENTKYSYEMQDDYLKALNGVLNQEPFAYDHADDPLYAALRKSSLREGDRTAADTLAELNARTGGVASSYGIRTASDAANQYNESLNASIPDLRKTAYQEYLGDFDSRLQSLDTLAQDRNFDYAAWLQEYQLQEADKQQEFQNALALYKRLGHLTPEIAAILGVPYVKPSSTHYGDPRPEERDDGTATDYLNALVAGKYKDEKPSSTAGINRGSGTGQSSVGSTINKEINAALKAGAITQATAKKLKETYKTGGSGGRYTY